MSRLYDLLVAHPSWISPRSDQHTVIGVPDSSDHRKTFVEPGGSFSPGVASFGVSVWLYDHNTVQLFTPETMSLDVLHWQWTDGYLPVLQSQWSAGGVVVKQELFALALSNEQNIVNTLQIVVSNQGSSTTKTSLYLVIRPYGPAGGPIHRLSLQENAVTVNGKVTLLAQSTADQIGALSFEQQQQEISELLKVGQLPQPADATDRDGLCSGVLAYDLSLAPGESYTLIVDAFVHPLEHDYLDAFRRYHGRSYTDKRFQVLTFWQKQLSTIQLEVPDKRFHDAYYSMLVQFLMATVFSEVRIATVTYPLFWLRDGAYIINALDKAGLHTRVRQQLERCKDTIFASGFGAEPDAFGEGIWCFLTHYQLTHDLIWLDQIYPFIKERADWIIKVRHTQEYLYADTTVRVPANRYVADTDLICEPTRDGLIQGRMDWHRPLIWINAFSYLGLSGVAVMAEVLGKQDDAQRYEQEARELQQALLTYAEEHFGENERDTVCAFWPTRALSDDKETFRDHFEDWWRRVRLQGSDTYTPEPLWKYFELGQAHNYLYLGERDKVLQTVNYYLEQHDVSNLYGWLEDDHDVAEYWSQIEGWYNQPSRQPHGWVSSEFFLLLRDMLLYEDGETLIIGSGIPAAWLQTSTPIVLTHMPSHFGPLDTTIASQDKHISITVHFATLTNLPEYIILALPWPTKTLQTDSGEVQGDTVRLALDHYRDPGSFTIHVSL